MNKTSYRTRFSYAATDFGGQLIFQFIIGGYIGKFFTDIYGITAGAAATILLVARWVDAVDAPVWGIIFDKVHSRLGKHRPWFLWLCVPYATFGVLTYLAPHLSYNAKVIYAAVTYILSSVLYTGINTPVTSILTTLTTSPPERITLMSFRMFGSKLGALAVNYFALGLVASLGHGDDRMGYLRTLPIYAAGCVLLFLVGFGNLKEVVVEEKKHQPILGTFGALKGNWPWLIIFASSLCFWIAFISRISAVPYFFEYNLHRKDLVPLAYSLDFISLATAFLLPWFCKWTSKTAAWGCGLAAMIAGQLVLYLGVASGNSVPLIMAGWVIGFLGSGMAMAVPFSVLSESVDYGEWKTGVRAAGLLTAIGAAFCLKAGAGLGGAIPLWIMSKCGYVPKVEQTATSLKGIEFNLIWLPAIFFLLSIIPVLFYKKYESLEPQIHAELEKRRIVSATEIK
ncbi:MAG TPA: glycoside-pentoside-hexuronide (GPH):cation symporter [Verrucomicrobiae bacterium]|nr:glycoside-pentoside-hexuronide (GPH):cation symporter [Verrucomicrobiae bacterium]